MKLLVQILGLTVLNIEGDFSMATIADVNASVEKLKAATSALVGQVSTLTTTNQQLTAQVAAASSDATATDLGAVVAEVDALTSSISAPAPAPAPAP